jgi:hypothetical protein
MRDMQVKVLSAPVSLYPLQHKLGRVQLLCDIFFVCVAVVHVLLGACAVRRFLRHSALHRLAVRVCPLLLASCSGQLRICRAYY